jgi:alanine racemase
VLNLPESSFTLVRVGLLLYGAFPSDEVPKDLPLEPVMEFTAPVVNLRKVKAGTLVSYGGVWSAPHDTVIGVIQVGFADGLPRSWYEEGCISLKGERYKIAGRVCMDQFTVDFFNANVKVGDEVLLFGKNKTDSILIEEISESIGSTPYVLFTAIGGRTKRIFKGL